jgi:hypothetical protein
MKISRLISLGKIFAIAILILGIIHDVATFTPIIKGGLVCLSPIDLKAVSYISLICGTSFILSGVLLLLLLKKVEQFVFLTSTVLFIGIFLALSGLLAIVFMHENPFSWIALIINLSTFCLMVGLKMNLDSNKRYLKL